MLVYDITNEESFDIADDKMYHHSSMVSITMYAIQYSSVYVISASICILVVLKKNLYVCMACIFAMNAYGREQKVNVL